MRETALTILYLAAVAVAFPLPPHVQPVVGILTQPVSAEADGINYSLVDSSYVRFLETGGAVVTPIYFNSTADDIEAQFHTLSGVFFTGGPSKPTDFDRYFRTASLLLDLSLKYDMPLWGTCLGFQTIIDITACGVDVLSNYHSEYQLLPLNVIDAARKSKLFGNIPEDVYTLLTAHNYTVNWHHYGVTPTTFESIMVPENYVALSVNTDWLGVPFVSTFEHATRPIYAVQWHPEANAYDYDHAAVDHSTDAIRAMQYFANFFVNETRNKGLGPGNIKQGGTLDAGPNPNIRYFPMESKKCDTCYAYVFA